MSTHTDPLRILLEFVRNTCIYSYSIVAILMDRFLFFNVLVPTFTYGKTSAGVIASVELRGIDILSCFFAKYSANADHPRITLEKIPTKQTMHVFHDNRIQGFYSYYHYALSES